MIFNMNIIILIVMTAYVMVKTHIINNLIIMEFISVVLIILMFKLLFTMHIEAHLMFYFIVMIITESIIGLAIMISTIRTHGNDYLKSALILKF